MIQSGATLTITSTVKFADNGKIIISPGGKLILNGGLLTSGCMWQGIEVYGTSGLKQSPITHGTIQIQGKGKIEYAKKAIRVFDGGIVKMYNGQLYNNRVSIVFEPFHNPLENGKEPRNVSFINNGKFICSLPMRDPIYTDNGVREGAKAFISLNDVSGITLFGNNFENQLSIREDLRGTGIVSYKASYSVSSSTFNNLTFGIESGAERSISSIIQVQHCNFVNVIQNICETGHMFSLIKNNVFNMPVISMNNPWIHSVWGINARESSGFEYSYNSFSGNTVSPVYGTVINNSHLEGGLVKDNIYTSVSYGTQVEDYNPQLIISCNTYNSTVLQAISIDPEPNTLPRAIKSPQGSSNSSGQQAGNLFYNILAGGAPQKHIYSTLALQYNAASNPIEALPIFKSALVNVNQIAGTINTNSCPPPLPPCSDDCTMLISQINLVDDKSEKLVLQNLLLRSYVDSGMIEAAVEYLEKHEYDGKAELLLPTYISLGEYSSAQKILDTLTVQTLDQMDYYKFYSILLQLGRESRGLNSMTEDEMVALDAIIKDKTRVSDMASYILKFIEGRSYDMEPEKWGQIKEGELVNKKINFDKNNIPWKGYESFELTIQPNPVIGISDLIIKNPEGAKNVVIKITDHLGRLISTYNIDSDSNNQLLADDFEAGVYFISLIVDQVQQVTKPFIVIH